MVKCPRRYRGNVPHRGTYVNTVRTHAGSTSLNKDSVGDSGGGRRARLGLTFDTTWESSRPITIVLLLALRSLTVNIPLCPVSLQAKSRACNVQCEHFLFAHSASLWNLGSPARILFHVLCPDDSIIHSTRIIVVWFPTSVLTYK